MGKIVSDSWPILSLPPQQPTAPQPTAIKLIYGDLRSWSDSRRPAPINPRTNQPLLNPTSPSFITLFDSNQTTILHPLNIISSTTIACAIVFLRRCDGSVTYTTTISSSSRGGSDGGSISRGRCESTPPGNEYDEIREQVRLLVGVRV